MADDPPPVVARTVVPYHKVRWGSITGCIFPLAMKLGYYVLSSTILA